MPLQILVAENDLETLETTIEALESEFEIIRAKSLDEAREAANSNPELAAILMDGRLERDHDQKDRSGWELADELQATGIARAPIIIYSQFEETRDNDVARGAEGLVQQIPRITYLGKEVEGADLTKRILEEIHLNVKQLNVEEIPRYHQPPILAFAHNGRNNGFKVIADELKKKGEPTQVLDNLDELKSAMNLHPSAMFAVDVTSQIGLEAINVLHTKRSNLNQNFYIAALTSGDEIRPDVLRADIDAFVTKDSPQTVASEIMVRKAEFKIEIERKQLALRQYRKLVSQLEKAKGSNSQEVSAALHTVQRALDWPFLLSSEKVILTSLYLQLLHATKAGMRANIWDICIEGTRMLAQDRAAGADVKDWIERARRSSAEIALTWMDDDALSGDIEENDD